MTPSWTLWYYLRIPAGAALGLIAYCVVRAGFVIGSVSALGSGAETINPFGVAAVSALAGISAKAILEKFGALADGVFGPRAPQQQTAELPKATIDRAGKKLLLEFKQDPVGVKVTIGSRIVAPAVSGRRATVDLQADELNQSKLSIKLSGAGLPADTTMPVDVPTG
ncbi:hypothetical protein C8P69_109212 [Phreatobacter oligotrophus]|uniref:Uncharacterized protein n=2 Tax=Phreatobacter oligotrophus TaxID=1122261 RepID=A0A2T4YYW4_9HYPH|nr:hypothetical protein C8P69_109212 [Phreatobacter oligotrophus]